MNILLAVSGSVAAIYTDKLIDSLKTICNGNVRVVLTKSAESFARCQYRSDIQTLTDDEETWKELGDPILHITLRNWADVLVVAPMSANTLAKVSNGISDSLVTDVVRAWDYSKPIIFCLSMNTLMWENNPTAEQIDRVMSWGVQVMSPVVKTLACGDTGIGAMCEHKDIVDYITDLTWHLPMSNPIIPDEKMPGAFGATRKYDMHTGIDLYCQDGDEVYAVEDGIVVNYGPFTGIEAGMHWWEDTSYLMVEGKSGVVCYGELYPPYPITKYVKRGYKIGRVKRVLPLGKERPDIPNHSLAMLHLELYRVGTTKPMEWELGEQKPRNLLNPTSRLNLAIDNPPNSR